MNFNVIRNDITKMEVDAVVLPANPELKEGSGASTAIFKMAGRNNLKLACERIIKDRGTIRVGTAIPTLGFNLEATYIIHTVVPKWRGGNSNEYELLCSAYYAAIKTADIMSCSSLAIPLLASGNNKFNLELVLDIAIKSIEEFEPTNELSDVYLVVYGMHAVDKVRKLSIPFEEVIDEAYVLGNDESYHSMKRKPKRAAKQYLDVAIDQAIDYFSDPENVEKIVGIGAEIIVGMLKGNE